MKILSDTQYSPEWWNARRGLPTASNFGRIITPARGDYSKQAEGYIYELIASLYDPNYGVVEDYQSAAMRNGTILEPEARRFYQFSRGVRVQEVGLCVTDCGRFAGSPDGLCGDDGCLEIKSPLHKTQVEYLLRGELPTEYRAQVHGHLIVTGRDWCDFLSYAQGLPELLVRVTPDDFTASLRESLERFAGEYDAAKARMFDQYGPPPAFEPVTVGDDIQLF